MMFNFSIIVFVFVIGWTLWFLIDKHPASLGVIVPGELDTLLDNFQLAFDMLTDGYLRASYVFIWKAHYLVLSVITALLLSAIHGGFSNVLHRRNLRQLMWRKQSSLEEEGESKK
ncbi:hypothetical protein MNBD_GAMMA05-1631 [hydrothermal vent metagenome]|uniref:Uncharacterized protein n=1 Tax=hydrothermal vent metagenome TaxID=652676 RepID=A0A3B0WTL5_9ZZZZ